MVAGQLANRRGKAILLLVMQGSGRSNLDGLSGLDARPTGSDLVYFFPDREITVDQVRQLLERGTETDRAWVISHLLRYAQWDDIWNYVTRDQVRDVLPTLELSDNLRQKWAKMLKVELSVSQAAR